MLSTKGALAREVVAVLHQLDIKIPIGRYSRGKIWMLYFYVDLFIFTVGTYKLYVSDLIPPMGSPFKFVISNKVYFLLWGFWSEQCLQTWWFVPELLLIRLRPRLGDYSNPLRCWWKLSGSRRSPVVFGGRLFEVAWWLYLPPLDIFGVRSGVSEDSARQDDAHCIACRLSRPKHFTFYWFAWR